MPPWLLALLPTIAAAAIGAAPGLFGKKGREMAFGKDASLEPFDLYGPDQESFQKDVLGQSQGVMGDAFGALRKLLGNDEDSLAEFSAPYMRQFQTQIAPMITERFGGGDSGASSGLQNAISEAGSGLESQIASDRQKQQAYGMNALSSLMDIGMRPRKGFMNYPGSEGSFQGILKAMMMAKGG